MEHEGIHNHPKLPKNKITASAMNKLETVVKAAPSIGPRALKLGSFSQQPAADIPPALNNKGHLAYLKRKVLKETGMKSTIASLAQFHKDHSDMLHFIVKKNVAYKHPHIIM